MGKHKNFSADEYISINYEDSSELFPELFIS